MINKEEIKEVRLVLDSILKMSNLKHREGLINDFIAYFLGYRINQDLTKCSNALNKAGVRVDINTYNSDFLQFDKIAELIEYELSRMGYNQIFSIQTQEIIREELESVGIMANSDEELEFINFLGKRWER